MIEAFTEHFKPDTILRPLDVAKGFSEGVCFIVVEATPCIRANAKTDAATAPVAAMTANAIHEDREASKEAGMNGHIAKLIDMNELKKMIF